MYQYAISVTEVQSFLLAKCPSSKEQDYWQFSHVI